MKVLSRELKFRISNTPKHTPACINTHSRVNLLQVYGRLKLCSQPSQSDYGTAALASVLCVCVRVCLCVCVPARVCVCVYSHEQLICFSCYYIQGRITAPSSAAQHTTPLHTDSQPSSSDWLRSEEHTSELQSR